MNAGRIFACSLALVSLLVTRCPSWAQSEGITSAQLQIAASKALDSFERNGLVIRYPAVFLYCDRTYLFGEASFGGTGEVKSYFHETYPTAETWLLRSQMLLEMYKRYLFRQSHNKPFAQAYLAKAQAIIDQNIESVTTPGTSWETFRDSATFFPSDVEDSIDNIMAECADAWARENGYKHPAPISKAVQAPTHKVIPVRFLVKEGTTVGVVPYTTHLLFEAMNRKRIDYPWIAIADGESLHLMGTYMFQVSRGTGQRYEIKRLYGTIPWLSY